MDESLRKINIISAIKEIFHILQKPDIHYSVKKIPLLVCARSTHYAHTHTHTHTRTHARMHAHAHTHISFVIPILVLSHHVNRGLQSGLSFNIPP